VASAVVALLIGWITRSVDFDPNVLRTGAATLLFSFGLLMIWPAPSNGQRSVLVGCRTVGLTAASSLIGGISAASFLARRWD
jgi:cytochrome c-type biogenesis protein